MKNKILCYLIGHQYRISIPIVFCSVFYCKRCKKEFKRTDSPGARRLWNTNQEARHQMMTNISKEDYYGDDITILG